MKFKTQEDFTNKINELITLGEEQGFSTKGILDGLIYSQRTPLSDFLKSLKLEEGKIDASKIKATSLYREGKRKGVRVEMWNEEE